MATQQKNGNNHRNDRKMCKTKPALSEARAELSQPQRKERWRRNEEEVGGEEGGWVQVRRGKNPRQGGTSRPRQNRQHNYEQARSTRHAGRPADSRKIRDASLFLQHLTPPCLPSSVLLYKFCFLESNSHVAKLYSQLNLNFKSHFLLVCWLNFTSSPIFRYFPIFFFGQHPVVLVLSQRMDSRCSGRRWEPRRRRRSATCMLRRLMDVNEVVVKWTWLWFYYGNIMVILILC